MPLGEPDGSRSARAEALSRVLISAGIKSPVRPKLRNEIWMKLWGNLSFNPVSVLTEATLEDLARMPESRAVISAMMVEAQAIGEALGVRFAMSVEDRSGKAEAVGAHRSSMLLDLDAGRPMELDALLGVMIELGRLVGLPTPTCQTVYNLTLCRARQAGCIS
jgi:2-dehydropantoate 2-reductase